MEKRSPFIINFLIWIPIIISLVNISIILYQEKKENKKVNIEDIKIASIDLKKLKLPKPQKMSCQKRELNNKRNSIKLEGILIIGEKKIAIINQKTFKEKEKINSIEIEKILDKEIIIKKGNKIINLRIGEKIEI